MNEPWTGVDGSGPEPTGINREQKLKECQLRPLFFPDGEKGGPQTLQAPLTQSPYPDALKAFAQLDADDERDAVAAFCQELGLESLEDQMLAAMAVQDFRAAKALASQMDPGIVPERLWSDDARIRIVEVNRARLAAQRGVRSNLRALGSSLTPERIQIVSAKVNVNGPSN